jgi:hypothetical protein
MGMVVLAVGCAGTRAEVRGIAPQGTATPVAMLARATSDAVTVQGKMVEK